MPPLDRYIDLHCERTQYGFFEEPLNALSNLGFIIAAFFLFKFVRTKKTQPSSVYFLILMCVIIGFGSMTFHVTARMWAAMYADVMPIAIFAIVFMYLFTHHILRLGVLGTLLLVVLLFVENVLFRKYIGKAPDGYVSLIPTALFLMLVCCWMLYKKNPSAKRFCLATGIAVIAIFCRSIDSFICDTLPIGTHFLWHSLMAVFMYIVVRELIIRHRKYDPPSTP